jgi:L-asparagine transporter-like permease
MGTSQIIMLVLLSLNLLLGAHFHGKERSGKYSFWVTLISVLTYLTLLITGGYFA